MGNNTDTRGDAYREDCARAWAAYNSISGRPNAKHVQQILRSTSTESLVRILTERGLMVNGMLITTIGGR